MHATFSYIAFYIHFDTHLTECRLHRHHGDGCQASCILKEMASGKELSEQVIALAYAFPVFLFEFLKKKPSFPHALPTGTLKGCLSRGILPQRDAFPKESFGLAWIGMGKDSLGESFG